MRKLILLLLIAMTGRQGCAQNQNNQNSAATVSSVSFTVPASSIFAVSGSPVTKSGTLIFTTSGTQGGIPWFNTNSTLNTTPILTQYGFIFGGGANNPPATSTTFATNANNSLSLNLGVISTDIVPFLAQWTTNSGTTVFTGMKWAATNTAQGAGSVNYQFCGGSSAQNCVTIDPNGNIVTPGTVTVGLGSGVAGVEAIRSGTSPTANAIAGSWNLSAPTSIAGTPIEISPAAAGSGYHRYTNAAGTMTDTIIDHPDPKPFNAAICNNATATTLWDLPSSNAPTVACRAGTNNLGGVLQWANNNATTNAQFSFELPGDWDTATQPWIAIYYGSGANTSGTVKWTFSSACTKNDGSLTDDPAFVAESTTAGKTMAVANRMWAESVEFANMTSGNNCVAGSNVIVKITSGNGTAASVVNVSKVVLTIPRLPVDQAD